MRKKVFISLTIALTLTLSSWTGDTLSDRDAKYLLKETKKVIKKTFSLDVFYLEKNFKELKSTTFLQEYSFYNIMAQEETKGYAIIARAPSKTDSFEYLLLFDLNFTIKKVKVLIYRENYGGEISSKRWLSQFSKYSEENDFVYGDNISAISGATISVKSITTSINDVMNSLKILKAKNEI